MTQGIAQTPEKELLRIEKIRLAHLGKKESLETRKKISETRKRLGLQAPHLSGEKSNNWKGGITKDKAKYRAMWHKKDKEKRAGRPKPKQCDACGIEDRIVFDHDHKTGKFRGWICNDCNWILGLAKDDKKILNLIIKYLDKYESSIY